jgi:Uma2 family endonuclease
MHLAQTLARTKIGPADHGRHMSLAEFDKAEAKEGYIYELSRGVIIVSEVPNPRHLAQVVAIRQQFSDYRQENPQRFHTIAGSGECKLLVNRLESERHPDVTVYKDPPPDEDVWSLWILAIVIEVVSPGSETPDYVEKREEYLRYGVGEYWIVDSDKAEMLVLRRAGGEWRERVVRPPEVYRTRRLPGFVFSCEAVFRAAEKAPR